MIKSATRRFASRKAEMTFSCESYNKDGMNSARRMLDRAIIDEAVKAMTEPEPEKEYFAVEDVMYDEDDWFPAYYTKMAFDNYNAAAEYAALNGGYVIQTDKHEFEYFLNDRQYWDFSVRRESLAA